MAPKVEVGGKMVLKSQANALEKARATAIWNEVKTDGNIRRNPYTGVPATLTALEASVLDWCLSWYRAYERGKLITPIQTFDNMRYLFLALNTEAYYDLLD